MTVTLTRDKKKSRSYLKEVQQELKKVSWTSKEELKFSTKVVIGSVFSFGIAIYLVDIAVKGALDTLSYLVRMIGG